MGGTSSRPISEHEHELCKDGEYARDLVDARRVHLGFPRQGTQEQIGKCMEKGDVVMVAESLETLESGKGVGID